MKVVYDITVLGIAFEKPQGATGISRVIENLAFELAQDPQCDLVFASTEAEPQTLAYLKATERLSHVPHAQHPFDMWLRNYISYLNHEIFRPSIIKNIPLRIYRRGVLAVDAVTKSSQYTIGRDIVDKYDIFHATFLPPPKQMSDLKNIKRFQTVYDIIPLTHPQWFSSGESAILERVVTGVQPEDHVLAISQATKDDLCNYAPIDPERVIVTPLAANRAVFYPARDAAKFQKVKEKYGLPDAPYVLSLATLEPRKNTEHLIRCFGEMVRSQGIKDLHLVLTGSRGWQYDAIFDQIEGLAELKGRVIVTGRVDDADLAELYSHAMMFAYPSLYEGFGLPPLEAMQCGVPVITSNVSSLPEVVGNAGITVDPTDADALSQSLYDVYKDSALREKLSAQGLERAQGFSWEQCAQDTMDAYKKALG